MSNALKAAVVSAMGLAAAEAPRCVQIAALDLLKATGKPLVALLMNGPSARDTRRAALMKAQRELRPFVPGRDGLFLSNTWGDRNRDARLAPFVATWKRHRDRLHAGVAHPVGAKPDGVSWTGFVVQGDATLDVLLFRELAASASHTLDLRPFGGATAAEVLSPRGAARLSDGLLSVTVPEALDFVWVRAR